jgi:hypothetical protein
MPTFDEAIFRQRERTIDNIKRIYAVVYSISLTNILGDIFAFTRDWFTQQAAATTYKQLVAGL